MSPTTLRRIAGPAVALALVGAACTDSGDDALDTAACDAYAAVGASFFGDPSEIPALLEVVAAMRAGARGYLLKRTPFPELTDREREVLDLVAAGLDNASISRRLSVSPKTVRNRLSNVCTKVQVADRSEAIVRARDAGLGLG